MAAARSFARRLREAAAGAAPGDTSSPSTIRSLALQVSGALDRTTRQLAGSPPLSPSSDPVEAVRASANALVSAVDTFGADDWTTDRGGATAIEVLRSGIAEAAALVRQATRLTEATD